TLLCAAHEAAGESGTTDGGVRVLRRGSRMAGLTARSAARARTAGRAVPAGSAPDRTPDSTLAEIAADVVPAI
ncbi:hypothetical protein, partial [Micromonospora sp. NPDC049799]|uniref:hypothetical protein n=1 Tax=Micromonospora sp. NPDC049799 TaxID=3154741 RepID=UPI0033C10BAD